VADIQPKTKLDPSADVVDLCHKVRRVVRVLGILYNKRLPKVGANVVPGIKLV
jgi:hypothetical protein